MDYVNLNGFYKIWKEIHFEKICYEVFRINNDPEQLLTDVVRILDKHTSGITLMMLVQFKTAFVFAVEKDIKEHFKTN